MNLTTLAFNIIVVLILALVFFLMLSLIVFQFYNFDLGDAWAFSGSIFSGMTTLAAAFIASNVYNQWLDQKKLEALSANAKEKISEIPDLSVELLRFSSAVQDLVLKKNIYKDTQNPMLQIHITEFSAKIYEYKFIGIAMNFDMSFREIKDLMLLSDLKLYEALSKNMKSYVELIFNEKVLDIYNIPNNNIDERLKDLYTETKDNLSNFYRKLIDYKNFNYKNK